MIKMHIASLCEQRGIRNPASTLIKAGISQGIVTKYLKGKVKRLPLDHIEKLCLLFRCAPNDLFTWTPDKKTDDYPENPLQLIRQQTGFDLTAKIKSMTLEEIKKKFEDVEEGGK